MHCYIRSINLRLDFALIEDAIVRESLPKLNLNVLVRKVRNRGLRIRSQPKNVGEIELHLGAAASSSRNLITTEYGLVQHGRRPIAGVSALRRHVAMNHADAAHTLVGLSRTFTRRSTGLRFRVRRGRLPVLRRLLSLRLSDLHRRTGLLRGTGTFLSGLTPHANREGTCYCKS